MEKQSTVSEGDPTQLLPHSKMYEICDQYNVAGSNNQVQAKFTCACRIYWYMYGHFAEAAKHVRLRECVVILSQSILFI
jgi:hypothetical protein